MRICRASFAREVIERVRERGILVIADEIMTGFGRTGRLFACDHIGETPDLICLSKGLTGGFLPMAVTVATDAVFARFCEGDGGTLFSHGHSYTANPLGCAAAQATLELLELPETREAWSAIASAHERGLEQTRNCEVAVRQRMLGTIAAFELADAPGGYGSPEAWRVADWLRTHGGLALRPLGNVLYLMPPYCVTPEQLDGAWQSICLALEHASK
jgi:adenosylmethionine-8-amino-7-oxononanoate aminotransferase